MSNKELRKRFARMLMDDYWLYVDQQRQAGEIGIPTRQEYCASKNIEYGSWANWANGYRLPDETNRRKLAEAIGNKVYEVLGELPPIPAELVPLFKVADGLTDHNREILMKEAARLFNDQRSAPNGIPATS